MPSAAPSFLPQSMSSSKMAKSTPVAPVPPPPPPPLPSLSQLEPSKPVLKPSTCGIRFDQGISLSRRRSRSRSRSSERSRFTNVDGNRMETDEAEMNVCYEITSSNLTDSMYKRSEIKPSVMMPQSITSSYANATSFGSKAIGICASPTTGFNASPAGAVFGDFSGGITRGADSFGSGGRGGGAKRHSKIIDPKLDEIVSK